MNGFRELKPNQQINKHPNKRQRRKEEQEGRKGKEDGKHALSRIYNV
jgi:hypothetical protein